MAALSVRHIIYIKLLKDSSKSSPSIFLRYVPQWCTLCIALKITNTIVSLAPRLRNKN